MDENQTPKPKWGEISSQKPKPKWGPESRTKDEPEEEKTIWLWLKKAMLSKETLEVHTRSGVRLIGQISEIGYGYMIIDDALVVLTAVEVARKVKPGSPNEK